MTSRKKNAYCFLHCSWPRVCSTWTPNCLVQLATCRRQPCFKPHTIWSLHLSTADHINYGPDNQLHLSWHTASCSYMVTPVSEQCHSLWNEVLIDNILLKHSLLFSEVLPLYKILSNSITISTTKMWFHQSTASRTEVWNPSRLNAEAAKGERVTAKGFEHAMIKTQLRINCLPRCFCNA